MTSLLARARTTLEDTPLEREERWARIVAAVATFGFALAATWELFGELGAGHYASNASMGIIAENMARHGIIAPVWEYTDGPPDPSLYYCHHPWGIFWITRIFVGIFGHHDFVCRLPAVVSSIATVPMIFAIARRLYRPWAGAAAALAFVTLPIALSFSNFNALEVPVMAFSCVGMLGLLRAHESARRRDVAMGVLGFAAAMNCDWPAFLLVGGILIGVLPWLVFPSGPTRVRRMTLLFGGLVALAALVTLSLHLHWFRSAGKLDDLLESYRHRSQGQAESLSAVLASRRYWIELSFTPMAIALGKVGVVVIAFRALAKRDARELIPLAVLAMASIQYVVFRQGADIHVFWPHYFALYYAFAFGAITATCMASARAFEARRGARHARRIVAGISVVVCLVVGRDGVSGLDYARGTGGRFNEKGLFIASDGDKAALLAILRDREPWPLGLDESMFPTWSQVWTIGRRVALIEPHTVLGANGTFVFDARFSNDGAKRTYVEGNAVEAVGPYWIVTRGHGLTGKAFEEREPTWLESYFVSAHEPRRTLVDDPFLAWEIAAHYGGVAEVPSREPERLEELRIAHNLALARGDTERAAAMLDRLGALASRSEASLGAGITLRFVSFEGGALPRLRLIVEAEGPRERGSRLSIRGRVVEPPPFSTVGADPVAREVAFPPLIGPAAWKAGFLYSIEARFGRRPGREELRAKWSGSAASSTSVLVHTESRW